MDQLSPGGVAGRSSQRFAWDMSLLFSPDDKASYTMKVQVRNLSASILALPHPLSITLTAGKVAVVSVSDQEWKVVQASPQVARLVQARLLAFSPLAAPEPAALVVIAEVKAAPVVEAPKAVIAEAPAPEAPAPEAEAPEAEAPAVEAIVEEQPKKKKKK